jgi:hypothetical protein
MEHSHSSGGIPVDRTDIDVLPDWLIEANELLNRSEDETPPVTNERIEAEAASDINKVLSRLSDLEIAKETKRREMQSILSEITILRRSIREQTTVLETLLECAGEILVNDGHSTA